MKTRESILPALLGLSHDLGLESRQFAILGEGNTSAKIAGGDTFLVKASGSSLGNLTESDLVECRSDALLPLLDQEGTSDEAIDAALFASRVNPEAKKPSVEAIFHAYLLTLADITFVGHTHPTAVNAILCSPRARDFATRRLFPDEIVCCGPESVFVPYTDPGLALAQAIRSATESFVARHGRPPRVILLENHGLIAIGSGAGAVQASTRMAVKSAGIFLGAAALGGPQFLDPAHIARIEGRRDEEYRRRALKL